MAFFFIQNNALFHRQSRAGVKTLADFGHANDWKDTMIKKL
jgi:hypothetical protein